MSNFLFLLGVGLLSFIVITPILNWLCDHHGELDPEKEDKLTENYK